MKKHLRKTVSADTIKRMLKAAGYTWKRVRRSLKTLRHEADFRASQKYLAQLRKACADEDYAFDLIYFDETGFTLTPCIPYAWQAPDQTVTLPSTPSPRVNVLGFLNLRGDFQSYLTQSTVNAEFVIAGFDAYCARLTKPCLIVLDNASMHRSAALAAKLKEWTARGMHLLFLPPYSPELNLIEILWRKLKYEWLPWSAYDSFKQLTHTLESALKEIGSKYLLSFA